MSNVLCNFCLMQHAHKRIASGLSSTRSAISNGSRLLDGIDGRSPKARRFRDLVRAFEDEVGGEISEVDHGLIKQAAAITLRAEQLQADLVNGVTVDGDHLIRLTGTSNRILLAIKKRATKHTQPRASLHDHIAARRAAAAE